MGKFKRFFQNLLSSIIDFSYYKKIAKARFSFSLKYIFFLLFIFQFIYGVIIAVNIASYLPKTPQFIADVKRVAEKAYPDDLVVEFNNGKVSTNQTEPYSINLPEQELSKSLITIDTKAKIEDISKYDTFFLVTENAVVYPDRDSSYRVQLLNDIKGEYIVDKNLYQEILPKVLRFLDYAPFFILFLIIISITIGPVVLAGLILLFLTFYVLVGSFFVFVLTKILNCTLTYKKTYQLSYHAVSLPVILHYFSGYLKFSLPFYVYAALYFALMLIVIFQFKKNKKV